MERPDPITIHDLYPSFSDDQIAQAEATNRRYVAVMARIFERVRLERGPDAAGRLARGDLTAAGGSVTVPGERSNPSLTNHEMQ